MTTDIGAELEAQEVDCFHELLPALRHLDTTLANAVERAQAAFNAGGAVDRFRGLYISDENVERMLRQPPGESIFSAPANSVSDTLGPDARLTWLAEVFALDSFDTSVVLLALAPEIDLRYERLYAYLQDDVTRRKPTVDLATSLFCELPHDRALARSHFTFDAPLLRRRVISLAPDTASGGSSLLSHSIQLDEQIVNLLLGHDALDRRLDRCCRLSPTVAAAESACGLPPRVLVALGEQVAHARESLGALRIHLHGPEGSGRRTAAHTIAAVARAPLLSIDVRRLFDAADATELATVAVREAWLRGAVLTFEPWLPLEREGGGAVRDALERALAEHPITFIAIASAPPAATRHGSAPLVLELVHPTPQLRREYWRRALQAGGDRLDDASIDALAAQFRLTRRQIEHACAAARTRAWRRAAVDRADGNGLARPGREDWLAGARAQGGEELEELATRIRACASWSDLVLPADSMSQLHELCQRVALRNVVMSEWGFDRRLSRGRGINALFSGPSGTGKTMAAEIVASELKLDLFRIELAGIVSKYIGETEKNLDRIFACAERANGILLFDEADALFGKRSEVRDSHDRYANLEISYLLQKMEQFDGIAILATNLRGNLDEAFMRRLSFTVHFPVPDEESRQRIWSTIWPSEAPLAGDVDFDFLARQFALSGGNIKNIALGAAFFAAERGEPIGMRDLMRASVREYQKLGKTLTKAEMGPYADPA